MSLHTWSKPVELCIIPIRAALVFEPVLVLLEYNLLMVFPITLKEPLEAIYIPQTRVEPDVLVADRFEMVLFSMVFSEAVSGPNIPYTLEEVESTMLLEVVKLPMVFEEIFREGTAKVTLIPLKLTFPVPEIDMLPMVLNSMAISP